MAVIDILQATVDGDAVAVTGTVDGKPYATQVWLSHLNTLGTKAARRAYVAAQLKARADRDAPKAPIDLSGTPITL